MLSIPNTLLKAMYAEAEKQYPDEACGFVIGRVDSSRTAQAFIPTKNLQNKLHAKDPGRYPRDAKTAYSIDPRAMEEVVAQAKARGFELFAIFHSHPEHGVYFSEEDKNMAAPWGEPLFPQLSYIVVSVYGGIVTNASDFYWDPGKKDFIEQKIK